MQLAPIAVFVFKRPEHTRRCLEALSQNPEFMESELFVFCDGVRDADDEIMIDATRAAVRQFVHPQMTIVEAPTNLGLARSIEFGVSRLCNEFGCVIVVEDDLVVSSKFLSFLNRALLAYADDPRVMQVSGHMFDLEIDTDAEAFFLPVTTSWGWGTWDRAWKLHANTWREAAESCLRNASWRYRFDLNGSYPFSKMLADSLAGRNSSWAIQWYFRVYTASGLVLFPRHTLVVNQGFDGSGTHCGVEDRRDVIVSDAVVSAMPVVSLDKYALAAFSRNLRFERGYVRRLGDFANRVLNYLRH